jgi:hypothetical protein
LFSLDGKVWQQEKMCVWSLDVLCFYDFVYVLQILLFTLVSEAISWCQGWTRTEIKSSCLCQESLRWQKRSKITCTLMSTRSNGMHHLAKNANEAWLFYALSIQ